MAGAPSVPSRVTKPASGGASLRGRRLGFGPGFDGVWAAASSGDTAERRRTVPPPSRGKSRLRPGGNTAASPRASRSLSGSAYARESARSLPARAFALCPGTSTLLRRKGFGLNYDRRRALDRNVIVVIPGGRAPDLCAVYDDTEHLCVRSPQLMQDALDVLVGGALPIGDCSEHLRELVVHHLRRVQRPVPCGNDRERWQSRLALDLRKVAVLRVR